MVDFKGGVVSAFFYLLKDSRSGPKKITPAYMVISPCNNPVRPFFNRRILFVLFWVGSRHWLEAEKRVKTGNDFLMSNKNIPLWITSLAFILAKNEMDKLLINNRSIIYWQSLYKRTNLMAW